MDPRGPADISRTNGLHLSERAVDLISDIHRRQRRRVLVRAIQALVVVLILVLAGLAVRTAANRRSQTRTLEQARDHTREGTVAQLRTAARALEDARAEGGRTDEVAAALALVRAQLLLEFGENEAAAREAVAALGEDTSLTQAAWARAMLTLHDGDSAGALEHLDTAADQEAWPAHHDAWIRALARLAQGPQQAPQARTLLEQVSGEDAPTSHTRLLVTALMLTCDTDTALEQLATARAQHRTHMGMAADEALLHAYLRQELGGVADVADQLLAEDGELLGARDRAHARLARGVVHVLGGEPKEGLDQIGQAWTLLPPWDHLARELALQTALEAGDADRVAAWLADAHLPEPEAGIYLAWVELARGDATAALARLAKLPQEHPRVAYLQGLALVEQGRHAEAAPWLTRAAKLLPGRTELEVAQARVDLVQGDPDAARRRLQALAEEEPYAPRAFTGLGEALASQRPPDWAGARKALSRALEREPVPAEAALLLARAHLARRATDPEAEPKALELLERASKLNPHLPRYRAAHADLLAQLGHPKQALAIGRELLDVPGADPNLRLSLVRWTLDAGGGRLSPEQASQAQTWLEEAAEAGADPARLLRTRARLALALEDREQWVGARDELSAHLGRSPADVQARVLLSRLQTRLGERDAAENTLRRGVSQVPGEQAGPLYLEWARLDARRGQRRKAAARARVAWSRLLDADPPPPPDVLIEAAGLAADLWLRQGKSKTALSIARKLTDRLPNRGAAWLVRAKVELGANHALEARSSAEKAVALAPDAPRAHEVHGHTLLRFGHKGRARKAYERAVELAAGTALEDDMRDNLSRL